MISYQARERRIKADIDRKEKALSACEELREHLQKDLKSLKTELGNMGAFENRSARKPKPTGGCNG
jgi:septal ring factor EnvC (AmiA/AmiB activator)